MVYGYIFWLKQIPIHQLTTNLCFNIPFHHYFHDLILDEPIATVTGGATTYTYPRYRQTATFHDFPLPFFGWNGSQSTNSPQIYVSTFLSTSTFMISSKMNQSVQLPVGEHIRTPDIGKLLHFMVFGYHFLAETDPNPPTNPKSKFQHSFPPLHSRSRLRRTNRYTYRWGDHIRTLDIGKLLHFIVFGF